MVSRAVTIERKHRKIYSALQLVLLAGSTCTKSTATSNLQNHVGNNSSPQVFSPATPGRFVAVTVQSNSNSQGSEMDEFILVDGEGGRQDVRDVLEDLRDLLVNMIDFFFVHTKYIELLKGKRRASSS